MSCCIVYHADPLEIVVQIRPVRLLTRGLRNDGGIVPHMKRGVNKVEPRFSALWQMS